MDKLIESGVLSSQPFSVDLRSLAPEIPVNFLQNLLFKAMYSKQNDYEKQLKKKNNGFRQDEA